MISEVKSSTPPESILTSAAAAMYELEEHLHLTEPPPYIRCDSKLKEVQLRPLLEGTCTGKDIQSKNGGQFWDGCVGGCTDAAAREEEWATHTNSTLCVSHRAAPRLDPHHTSRPEAVTETSSYIRPGGSCCLPPAGMAAWGHAVPH